MSRLIDPMEPMEYINHPNEVLRLLRYFVRPQMDPEERILPEYPAEPSLGVVISTYGSIPFLDLNLHYLVNVNRLRVLIHDDCSPARDALIDLCRRYAPHVDLYSTTERMWHKEKIGVIGDTNSFLVGLQWAQQNKFDILVKLIAYDNICCLVQVILVTDFIGDLTPGRNSAEFPGSFVRFFLFFLRKRILDRVQCYRRIVANPHSGSVSAVYDFSGTVV